MFVMLTARGCGHCEFFRGNGELNNGKEFMENHYILPILKKKIKIYNIHYNSMNGINTDIISISKIEKVDNGIEQNIFYIKDNSLHHKKIVLKNSLDVVFDENKNINWIEFVKNKIPLTLQNYTYYFPCFGMFKVDNWDKSIKHKEQLMGILNLGFTVIDNTGNIFLYKDGKFLEKRKLSNDQLIDKVLSGDIKFEPLKIKDLLNNKFEITESVDLKTEKINDVEKEKMIIIQY